MAGEGEVCPDCGEGTLVQKRGRFGAFVGCSRYPDCKYIRKDGPPPPEQLPFEVACPTCTEGHLVARRARRTGSVFWGCSRYPKCTFTTSREPVGAVHDVDAGVVARNPDGTALCLKCGAAIPLPEVVGVGELLAGGPAGPRGDRAVGASWRPTGCRHSAPDTAKPRTKARPPPPRRPIPSSCRRNVPPPDVRARRVHRDRDGARGARRIPAVTAAPGTRRRTPSAPTRPRCGRSWPGWTDQPGADWRTPSRRELRAWLASLSADGLSRSSIAARLAAMRSFYRHARRPDGCHGSVAGHRDAAPVEASAQGAGAVGRGAAAGRGPGLRRARGTPAPATVAWARTEAAGRRHRAA